jgi:hypothetical protein
VSDFYGFGSGGDNLLPPQPFANYALDYQQLGLAIIPCEGKSPKVSWKKYQSKAPSLATIYRWIKLFPAANIGLITGKISGITVIDCDDPNLSLEELEAEFGESKFVVSTPSGGRHLYYSFNGENSKTGYKQKIDVKGEGGLIIAPHSFKSDKKTHYTIARGSFEDLTSLTTLKLNLANKRNITHAHARGILPPSSIVNKSDFKIAEGQRNNYLFNQLRKAANNHQNYQSFEDYAFEINAFSFEQNLDGEEIKRTSKNVWKLKEEGKLIIKGEGYVLARYEAEIVKLRKETRALALLLELKYHHLGVRNVFCIAQDAISKKLGWNKKSLVRAIEVLIEEKFIFRHKIKNEKRRADSKIKIAAYQYSFCLG